MVYPDAPIAIETYYRSRAVNRSMANEDTVTTTELDVIEPIGETCVIYAQLAFDVATALF